MGREKVAITIGWREYSYCEAQRPHNGYAGKERRSNSRAEARHVEDARTEYLEVCPKTR